MRIEILFVYKQYRTVHMRKLGRLIEPFLLLKRAHPRDDSYSPSRKVSKCNSEWDYNSQIYREKNPNGSRTYLLQRSDRISKIKQNHLYHPRPQKLGYQRLKELAGRNDDEIVLALTDKKNDVWSLMEDNIKSDQIILIGIIMAKVSSSSIIEKKVAVLTHLVSSNQLEIFFTHCCDIVAKTHKR